MPGPDRQAFVRTLYPIARRYAAATGLPADVLLAIAAHESNFGNAGGNMLFGIKGPGATMATHEIINGRRVDMPDSFRTYATPDAAFKDFVNLVSQGRYAPAWQQFQQTGDWRGFLQGITRAGYATDQGWGNKIASFAQSTISPLVSALGPTTAEAAEMPATEQGRQPVAEPRQPSTAPGSWRGQIAPTAPKGPTKADRVRAQIGETEAQAQGLRDEIAQLATPGPEEIPKSDAEALSPFFESTSKVAYQKRKDALDEKQKQLAALEGDVRAEKRKLAAGEYDEKPTSTTNQKPTTQAPTTKAPQVLVTHPDGSQTWEDNPNYRDPATLPKATRTWRDSSGVTHTETAPDEGGFSPVTDAADPNAMTDYQRGELGLRGAELPIQQQNADSSSLSAAASLLHAQVAKGTMDFTIAKGIFDYIVAQQPPIEEGGKLWARGGAPSDPTRRKLGLAPVPWRGIDIAGMAGHPEMNQYVRGADAFGAGPMTPEEYHARQAGTWSGGVMPPAGAPPPPMAPPQPAGAASSSAGTMLAAGQGGFAPQPAAPPPQQAPPMPAFGGVAQPMDQPPMPAQPPPQAPDGDLQKIVALLVSKGFSPEVAQAAAQQHLGMGGMPAQY